jgi:transcriptional regulator with XRE-family HTH domain
MGRFNPPSPASIAVGEKLRELRLAQGLTMAQLAATANRSQTWVSRVEAGIIRPRPPLVRAVLLALGVDPDSELGKEILLSLAHDPTATGWWRNFAALNQPYVTFIRDEAIATTERNAELLAVPGLLQTREYALALSRAGRDTDPAVIELTVQARLKRQEALLRPDPLVLHAIVSQAALQLQVGGEAVRREQLRHIMAMAQLPNVTVEVVPWAAGAQLVVQGGFYILEFDHDQPPKGYFEVLLGKMLVSQETDTLTAIFNRLHTAALPPDQSLKLIEEKLACQ